MDYTWIAGALATGVLIGIPIAVRVQMTAMPEMVALFNGFGGAASALVALSVFWSSDVSSDAGGALPPVGVVLLMLSIVLSVLIGVVTFSGSLVAFGKLRGMINRGRPVVFPARHWINGAFALTAVALGTYACTANASPEQAMWAGVGLVAVGLGLGMLAVLPIGGADMPVVVSLLNSYSGLAAAMTGFVLGNLLLIIAGVMVGASGLVLTKIMCTAMNRSLASVLLGGVGQSAEASPTESEYQGVRSCDAEEAAMVLEHARSVVIVPGYGLAVAQAQHAAPRAGRQPSATRCEGELRNPSCGWPDAGPYERTVGGSERSL